MRTAHVFNAWLMIGLNAFAGVWCLAAYRWKQLEGRSMWIVVIVAEATAFVQAALGALYAKRSGVEIHDMHMLYGVSALVAVAILYSYRGSPFIKDKVVLMYGFGSLFIMGLGLRNLVL
jgi:hypothetical protein